MLVLDLACGLDHRFEGWFGSAGDFESQLGRGLIACPVCGSTGVQRRPSATRINVAHLRGEAAHEAAARPSTPAASSSAPAAANAVNAADAPSREDADRQRLLGLQRQALQQLRQWVAGSEDVGERFADEARRIHQGDAEVRAIRGRASAEQAAELVEEGIAVLPLPESFDEPLQ